LISNGIAELLAHGGQPIGMFAGVEGIGGIFRGLAAIATFIVGGGAGDCFGGDFYFLRALTGAGEKAADNERSIVTCL